jgi:hypothetical protein
METLIKFTLEKKNQICWKETPGMPLKIHEITINFLINFELFELE